MNDTGTFVITSGTDDDREWAAGLMAASDPWLTLGRGIESCRAACRRAECLLFVARDAHGRCGFALVNPRGVAGAPYLAAIAIDPAWRGRGVGTALMAYCEGHAALTSRHFFLCVSSFNTRAQNFYQRHGYTRVGEFEDYVISGASELLLYKRVR